MSVLRIFFSGSQWHFTSLQTTRAARQSGGKGRVCCLKSCVTRWYSQAGLTEAAGRPFVVDQERSAWLERLVRGN